MIVQLIHLLGEVACLHVVLQFTIANPVIETAIDEFRTNHGTRADNLDGTILTGTAVFL